MALAQGADLSHWQSDPTFAGAIKGKDFVAIKACEGGGTDPEWNDSDDHRWTTLGSKVASGDLALRMAYVFLVMGQSASSQVDALQALTGKATATSRHAIDWEAGALASPTLLADAVKHDWDLNKVPCLVYCSDANVPAAAAALGSRGMKVGVHYFWWIARYGATPTHSWTFWQDVGTGVDHDVFYSDRAKLVAWTGAGGDDDVALTDDQVRTLNQLDGVLHGAQDAWDGKGTPTPKPGETEVGDFVYVGFNIVRFILGKPIVKS